LDIVPGIVPGIVPTVRMFAASSRLAVRMVSANGLRAAGAASAAIVGSAVVGSNVVLANEADHGIPSASYPWSHEGAFKGFDAQSIRRGYQVYRGVCATCHSLNRIAWRNMEGVCYTEAEVKALAAEIEYPEPPDDEGNVEMRAGKNFDYFPAPYETEAAARSANGGAYPPDLSLIVKARHNGANYVFSLLTGFVEAPVNVSLGPGQNYNPYFPGGKIAMARPLQDGQVEYDDGTPATTSQMAKDVTIFLNWAAEPEHDLRKKMGMQWCAMLMLMVVGSGYMKRFRWSLIKTRKLKFE